MYVRDVLIISLNPVQLILFFPRRRTKKVHGASQNPVAHCERKYLDPAPSRFPSPSRPRPSVRPCPGRPPLPFPPPLYITPRPTFLPSHATQINSAFSSHRPPEERKHLCFSPPPVREGGRKEAGDPIGCCRFGARVMSCLTFRRSAADASRLQDGLLVFMFFISIPIRSLNNSRTSSNSSITSSNLL